MFFFDPWLMVMTAPAILLMMWAQYRLRSTYSAGMQIGTPLSGAAAGGSCKRPPYDSRTDKSSLKAS